MLLGLESIEIHSKGAVLNVLWTVPFLILWCMNHNHSLFFDRFIRFTIKSTINGVFFAILIPFLTCTCFEVYFSTACKFALLLKRLPFISQAFMQVCILIQGYICFLPFQMWTHYLYLQVILHYIVCYYSDHLTVLYFILYFALCARKTNLFYIIHSQD